jgi:hypothetical protein
VAPSALISCGALSRCNRFPYNPRTDLVGGGVVVRVQMLLGLGPRLMPWRRETLSAAGRESLQRIAEITIISVYAKHDPKSRCGYKVVHD